MSTWRDRVAPWVPPAVSAWSAARASGDNVFREFSGTWAEAEAAVQGYGDATIIDTVVEATRAVERGEAAFERDSVLFAEPEYTWPLLSALLHSAARDARLSVLDFGGALGSTYRQHRRFLADLPEVRWTVVEQPAFVEIGQREFQTSQLHFAPSIAEAVRDGAPTVVLLGSSLQYLETPHEVLAELADSGAPTIVIDRTPLSDAPDDVLCIQTVPPSIYEAAYPMWILSRSRLLANLEPQWTLIAEYGSGHGTPRTSGGLGFAWDGLIIRRD